jgi:integrase
MKITHDKKLGRWVADTRPVTPAPRRFKTKAEAQAFVESIKRQQREVGEYVAPGDTKTFADAVDEYLKHERRRMSAGEIGGGYYDNQRVALEQIAAFAYDHRPVRLVRLGEFEAPLVRAKVRDRLFDDAAYDTAAKKLACFQRLFAWAIEYGYVSRNPADVKIKKKPSRLERPVDRMTPEQVAEIIAHTPDRYRLRLKFLAMTGLRVGEMLALKWDQVDKNYINVVAAIKKSGERGEPKSRAGRRKVPVVGNLYAELLEHRARQNFAEKRSGLVFPTQAGHVDNASNIRRRGLYKGCDAAGVERIRLHDLRHYFASQLLYTARVSHAEITQMMGHHSISFTQEVYGHWIEDAARDAEIAEKLSTAFEV